MTPVAPGATVCVTAAASSAVYQHLTHFQQPELQTYVVRILWMVPVYGIESWFSLRFFSVSIYMATLREWCDAPPGTTANGQRRPPMPRVTPCLAPVPPQVRSLRHLLLPLLPHRLHGRRGGAHPQAGHQAQPQGQAPLSAVLHAPVVHGQGVPHEVQGGDAAVCGCQVPDQHRDLCVPVCWRLRRRRLRLDQGIRLLHHREQHLPDVGPLLPRPLLPGHRGRPGPHQAARQVYSRQGGRLLLVVVRRALAAARTAACPRPPPPPPCPPLRQGVAIAILVKVGVIHDTKLYSSDELAKGLQDFIICIEMFIAAIAHKFAFPYQVRAPAGRRAATCPTPILASRTFLPMWTSRRTSSSPSSTPASRSTSFTTCSTQSLGATPGSSGEQTYPRARDLPPPFHPSA